MTTRKSLVDILQAGQAEKLAAAWQSAEAAEEFTPLPAGDYGCRILAGELCQSKSNHTPGYKITFEVVNGDFAGRRIWHDIWLTQASLPMAKRDLMKLGVTNLDQLASPLPRGILARVKLSLRKDDSVETYNRVRAFEVTGVEKPDPFAPAESSENEHSGDTFNFGANVASNGPYRGDRR